MTTRRVPGGRARLPTGKRSSQRWLTRRTFRERSERGGCSTLTWADSITMSPAVRRWRGQSFEHNRRVSMLLHEHGGRIPEFLTIHTAFTTQDNWSKFGGEQAFVTTYCDRNGISTVIAFASELETDR